MADETVKVLREAIGPAFTAAASTSLMFASLALYYELGVAPWLAVPLILAGFYGCYFAGKWERSRALLHYVWGYRARERDEAGEYLALATGPEPADVAAGVEDAP